MNAELVNKVDEFIAQHKDAMIEDIMALARIPSVRGEAKPGAPYGEVCRSILDEGVTLAGRHGFEAEVHSDKYALLHHGDGEKSIAFYGHLDVVPEGKGWTVTEPFNPVYKDGLLVGRGVDDNKAGVVIGLYTIKAVRDLGIPVKSRLTLFMGSNEESGMDDVKTFAAEQPMPDFSLVPDARFPVCNGEKGGLRAKVISDRPFAQVRSMAGGVATNVVCEEVRATLEHTPALKAELERLCAENAWVSLSEEAGELVLIAKGIAAHASMPEKSHNATWEMVKLLAACEALCAEDREIAAFAAEALSDVYGNSLGIAASDEPSGPLTCVNGLVGLQDGRMWVTYDVRYCVTLDGAVVKQGFERYFAPGSGWSIDTLTYGNGYYVPEDDARISTLLNIYHEITGDREGKPFTMGGGTYARQLKNAVAFGPAPRVAAKLDLPENHGGVHQPDEALVVSSFLEAVKIYILAVAELDKVLGA
ncbi:MAG: M20 family metallopeptidase [Clostridiales bacterium]|nr:M20 family metallopeptidase [Clostridiales bacterium]